MKNKFTLFIVCIIFIIPLSTNSVHAQILNDTTAISQIKKIVDYIYNFQFNDARDMTSIISKSYPEHPVVYLLKGMITYWEHYPLLPPSPDRISFEKDLRECIYICEQPHNMANDIDYLLSNLCARGMLMLFYSDNGMSMEVIKLAPSTYQFIRKSFDFTSSYSDFYYFTGLYNYYREAYPEEYPVYKTLAFLFPSGDKAKGLRELQIATKNAMVLKAESFLFLSGIYSDFEHNYQLATTYSQSLFELYPANLEYRALHIKNLLLTKRYDGAERLITSSGTQTNNSYFQTQLAIFNGILQEKKYHNFTQAQRFYFKGAKDITSFGDFGNEFEAYAYFGLSRISEINGDKNYSVLYRKHANELAYIKDITFD